MSGSIVTSDPSSLGLVTVTLVFTDIEGSTRLVQELGEAYPAVFDAHHRILREAVEDHGGQVFRTSGDAVMAAFESPAAALSAAVAMQLALAAHEWPDGGEVRVRIGVHTGQARRVGDDYDGLDLHRVARIMSTGWGGQIVVSAATSDVAGALEGAELKDLGEHRLKDLSVPERLYQVVATGLPSEFPPLRSLDATPNNLPTQLTTFVGREDEVAEAARLLAGTRLLTLTGPGGTGKTRLSLQLAADVADRFPDGVFFVPLADVTDPGLVLSATTSSIGLADRGSDTPLERLSTYLAGKRALLVLDNFEQVLPAAKDIAALLAAAPEISLVVSSRGPLRISGEQEYPVPPLGLPNGSRDPTALLSYASVELFVARAAAVKPDFLLTTENAEAVVTIARQLEGLPLALELAAARMRVLPAAAIADRLRSRLDLLAGGGRDVPTRQRTLRDAIAWSYDLLEEPVKRVFEDLSVFLGGASLDGVEIVCSGDPNLDVFEALDGLVDQSLMRVTEHDGHARYEMLEVIREYALERLEARGDADDVRRRHVEHFAALAEQAAPHLVGEEQASWLDRLAAEHANLRTAVTYATELAETDLALRIVAAAWRYWQIRGHLHEGRRLAESVVAMPDVDDHPASAAMAFEAAGGLAYWQLDTAASLACYERSLALYRQTDDPVPTARALYNLAFGYMDPSNPAWLDLDRAESLLNEALERYQDIGDELGAARVKWALANHHSLAGSLASARVYNDESTTVFRAHGAQFDLAWARYMGGLIDVDDHNAEAAGLAFREALELFVAAGDQTGIALGLQGFAFTAEIAGDWVRSLRLLAAAERVAERAGTQMVASTTGFVDRPMKAEDQVSADVARRSREEGEALADEQALAYALEGVWPD